MDETRVFLSWATATGLGTSSRTRDQLEFEAGGPCQGHLSRPVYTRRLAPYPVPATLERAMEAATRFTTLRRISSSGSRFGCSVR